jgi:hypothetical protein
MVFVMYDFFRIMEVDSAMQNWDELIHVELKGDNLQQFYNDWDTACLNVRELPDERFMETLCRKQLSKSDSFKAHWRCIIRMLPIGATNAIIPG